MKKRIWINIILISIIFILSIYIFTPPDEGVEKPKASLLDIDKNSIDHIEIIRKDLDDFIFAKKDDAWHMLSPLQLKANPLRINTILGLISTKPNSTLEPSKVELKNLGLESPSVIVKLNKHVFKFGGTDGIDQYRYIFFANHIFLVDDSLYHQLRTNASFFANTKLLENNKEIIAIKYPDKLIEKNGNIWRTQENVEIKPERLSKIVSAWKTTKATHVSQYREEHNKKSIIIKTQDQKETIFNIVQTKPNLILARRDLNLYYHISNNDANQIMLEPITNKASQSDNGFSIQRIK